MTFVLVDCGLAVDVELCVGVDGDTDIPNVGVDLSCLVSGEGRSAPGAATWPTRPQLKLSQQTIESYNRS